MSREEFLRGLEEALAGEVPASTIRENLNYYGSYISQEMAKGRTMDQIVEEIGEPRIVARTIIDSCEAAGETVGGEDGYTRGGYSDTYENGYDRRDSERREYSSGRSPHIHYFDLNKWYWRILIPIAVMLIFFFIIYAVGGIFFLLMRFAGPIFLILLVYWFFKNMQR